MKLIALALFLGAAIPLAAQQAIVVPSVPSKVSIPGKTYNVDTCTYDASTGILTIDGIAVNTLTVTSLRTSGTPQKDGFAVYSGGELASNGVPSLTPITVTLPAQTAAIQEGATFTQAFAIPAGTIVQKLSVMWAVGAYPDVVDRQWDLGVYLTSATAGVVYVRNSSFQKWPFSQAANVIVSVN